VYNLCEHKLVLGLISHAVVVAMSGGVDSSVTAKLLAETVYTQKNIVRAPLFIRIIGL
jgi:tRNA(Ile)-lysidine synthase TilS/MesJ